MSFYCYHFSGFGNNYVLCSLSLLLTATQFHSDSSRSSLLSLSWGVRMANGNRHAPLEMSTSDLTTYNQTHMTLTLLCVNNAFKYSNYSFVSILATNVIVAVCCLCTNCFSRTSTT